MEKLSRSESGKIGAAKQIRNGTNFFMRLHKEKLTQYNASPNFCKFCGTKIGYQRRGCKFCNNSCSAKFYNESRKLVKSSKCINCNEDIFPSNKYCNPQCQQDFVWKTKLETIKKSGQVKTIGQARRYFDSNFPRECMICSNSCWAGSDIPLLIDHIDGNSDNWLLTNLRRICPNCDAQLPTFKSRNRGKGRVERRKRWHTEQEFLYPAELG